MQQDILRIIINNQMQFYEHCKRHSSDEAVRDAAGRGLERLKRTLPRELLPLKENPGAKS